MDNSAIRLRTDRKYLEEAYIERAQSDDPNASISSSSAVGAIIVLHDKIISRSANVIPPALVPYREYNKMEISQSDRYHYIEHAERAAIFKLFDFNLNLHGATMYCTRFPCSDCARAIVWVGISRVVIGSEIEIGTRWTEGQYAAQEVLRQAGVVIEIIKF